MNSLALRPKPPRGFNRLLGALGLILTLLAASTASATCTVNGTTNGALTVFSTFVFLSGAGTITLTNDSAGSHTVTIPGINALVAPVQGVDLDDYLTLDIQVISGPNAGATFGGSDSTSRTLVLANAGTDVIQLGVSGSLDSTAEAGTYQVNAIIDCT